MDPIKSRNSTHAEKLLEAVFSSAPSSSQPDELPVSALCVAPPRNSIVRRRAAEASKHLEAKFFAVHPTVTLSIVDHYTRVAKDSSKRVVGVLLGEYAEGKCHAASSFAVPFEEDMKDPSIWYLDHNYLETMAYMFSKINKHEHIIGWYSTGSKIKPADLEINELFRRYCPNPYYLLVNVSVGSSVSEESSTPDLPFYAYVSIDEPSDDPQFTKTFAHVPSGVAQYEAEEVGVEHLLRDIESASVTTRGTKILNVINGLRCLQEKLTSISKYLQTVSRGSLPLNHRILYNLQYMFNLTPDILDETLIEDFEDQSNNGLFAIYLASVVRAVTTLHDLVRNRLQYKLR